MTKREHIELAAGEIAFALSQFEEDRSIDTSGRKEVRLKLEIFLHSHLSEMGPEFAHLRPCLESIIRGAYWRDSSRLHDEIVALLREFNNIWRIPHEMRSIWRESHWAAYQALDGIRTARPAA